jgi:hypothetical protein
MQGSDDMRLRSKRGRAGAWRRLASMAERHDFDHTVVGAAQLEEMFAIGWELDPDRPWPVEGDRRAVRRRRVGSSAPVRRRRG